MRNSERVTVTMPPSARLTKIVSMAATILSGVGFNPYRKARRRPSDLILVAAAIVVAAALVLWALLG